VFGDIVLGAIDVRTEGAADRPVFVTLPDLGNELVVFARTICPEIIAGRKRKPKLASFSGFALDADLSFVRFYRKPAKGEAEAGRMPMLAAAVCLSKFFKDVFVLIARYPFAIVTDRNGRVSRRALKAYPNRFIRVCELKCIADEVLNSPPDDIRVAEDCHWLGRHFATEGATSQERGELIRGLAQDLRNIVILVGERHFTCLQPANV